MIEYSTKFVNNIKKVFGTQSHAYMLCLDGNEKLGVILKHNIKEGISFNQLFNAKSLKELQDLAFSSINLYELWYDEMLTAYGNDVNALDRFLHANNMHIDLSTFDGIKAN